MPRLLLWHPSALCATSSSPSVLSSKLSSPGLLLLLSPSHSLASPLIFFLRFMLIFLRGGEKSTGIQFFSDVMIGKRRPSLLSSCSAISSKTPRIPSKLEGICKDYQIQLLAPCSITQKSDPMSESGSCWICCYPRTPDSFQYDYSPASHPPVWSFSWKYPSAHWVTAKTNQTTNKKKSKVLNLFEIRHVVLLEERSSLNS